MPNCNTVFTIIASVTGIVSLIGVGFSLWKLYYNTDDTPLCDLCMAFHKNDINECSGTCKYPFMLVPN